MSEINIHYPLECHIDHSKQTLQTMLTALQEKYSIQHEFYSETECNLSGSGVNGNVSINDDGIEIYAKLGFFMIPFKSVIENEIINKLNKCFEV